jgi:hypothetical protein
LPRIGHLLLIVEVDAEVLSGSGTIESRKPEDASKRHKCRSN